MAEQNQILMTPMPPSRRPLAMDPRKFVLWLFLVSITMMFAALTSAYMVRKSEGNWLHFDLPDQFWISSLVIIVSSLTMHFALKAAKKDEFSQLKILMGLTVLLGIGFMLFQFFGWQDLVQSNVYFVGNPSGSFVYVFSGLHGAHIVTGLIFLFVIIIQVIRQKVHSKRLNAIQMCATYWHFLGGVWLYLFTFLLINH
jgi:cytochrome c oxidase subunit III